MNDEKSSLKQSQKEIKYIVKASWGQPYLNVVFTNEDSEIRCGVLKNYQNESLIRINRSTVVNLNYFKIEGDLAINDLISFVFSRRMLKNARQNNCINFK